MIFSSLRYDRGNLGDVIQSLAAEQFLPKLDGRVNRDRLAQVDGDTQLVIMNGWFSKTPENWPPSASILPIFVGFHIAALPGIQESLLNQKSIDYLKRHEPIGCRDRRTMEMLVQRGVKAFHSKCLTLTFPRREKDPANGKVFLVDASDIPVPVRLEQSAIDVTHEASDAFGDGVKIAMAHELLRIYKDEARLVITSRLHCALPCIALGVPVVFFGDSTSYRLSLLRDLGLPIYRRPPTVIREEYRCMKKLGRAFNAGSVQRKGYGALAALIRVLFMNRAVNWDPKPLDIEAEKANLIAQTRAMIQQRCAES